MKIRLFTFSLLFLAFLIFVGCQQNTTPTMPRSGVAQQSSSSTAAASVQTDIARSYKPDKKALEPDVDQDRLTDNEETNVDENIESHNSETEIGVAGEDTQVMSATENMGVSSLDPDEMYLNGSHDFLLRVSPYKWNVNWINSDGYVTVRIEGAGIEEIDPKTLQMLCESCAVPSDPETVFPVRWRFDANSLTAKFIKSEAIGLISEPLSGETYQMLISFSMLESMDEQRILSDFPMEDADHTLPFSIFLLGKKPALGDLSLVIRPKKWNKAWANLDDDNNAVGDDDLITARIKGEGFDAVVPGSLFMSYGLCDSAASETITPVFEELGGTSYVAKFVKSEAIALIEDLKRGDTHPIRVTGLLDTGETFCLPYLILINGKKSGEGPLTLTIKPTTWNMAWLESDEDGEVTARIKGEDFDKIDPTSIRLEGPEGSIEPLSTEFAGFSFNAKFKQSAAIALITNPPTLTSYEVRITGTLKDGSPLPATLSFMVNIKKKK